MKLYLSSIFITSPDYGTRSTIIITKDINNKIDITERTYAPSGEILSDKKMTLDEIFNG